MICVHNFLLDRAVAGFGKLFGAFSAALQFEWFYNGLKSLICENLTAWFLRQYHCLADRHVLNDLATNMYKELRFFVYVVLSLSI